jgi:hypothetical protein
MPVFDFINSINLRIKMKQNSFPDDTVDTENTTVTEITADDNTTADDKLGK